MADVAWFGTRLTELRTAAGLSQAALAALLGVGASYVSDLETGRRLPAWGTALALADALGVGMDALASRPTVASPDRGRGRPRKAPPAVPPPPKRPRGRPRKEK
jgi:transcriptional regulator with XRE-family HTH domain